MTGMSLFTIPSHRLILFIETTRARSISSTNDAEYLPRGGASVYLTLLKPLHPRFVFILLSDQYKFSSFVVLYPWIKN